jgi:hypothetical protein
MTVNGADLDSRTDFRQGAVKPTLLMRLAVSCSFLALLCDTALGMAQDATVSEWCGRRMWTLTQSPCL